MSPAGSIAIDVPDPIVSRGDNVTFTCSADGGPNNVFVWLFSRENVLCEDCIVDIDSEWQPCMYAMYNYNPTFSIYK